MRERILITGGAGYVGSILNPMLLEKGYRVRVLDNLTFGGMGIFPCFAHRDFEFMKGDIRSRDDIKKALADVDMVIHLAAIVGYPACRKDPRLSREINVDGARILAKAANRRCPIIFASTGSTYGKLISKLCTETSPLNPLSGYAEQKAEAEAILRNTAESVIFRFATGFGVSPRHRLDLLVNDFTFRAVKEGTIIVYERHFMRTFIHVRDMAKSFLFAVEHLPEMKGEIYNVGDSGMNYSKEQICLMIKSRVDFYLHFADIGKDMDQRDYQVSYEKIGRQGFGTSISMEDGIDELIHAYQVLDIKNPYSNV